MKTTSNTPLALLLLAILMAFVATDASAQAEKAYEKVYGRNAIKSNGNKRRVSPADYKSIADGMLRTQNDDGGWPKGLDWLDPIGADSIYNSMTEKRSTLDNRATFTNVEFLAYVASATKGDRYRVAAIRGLDYIYRAQSEVGGWRGGDIDAIMFNGNVMPNVLRLLKKVAARDYPFEWISKNGQKKALDAFNKGVECVLRCQYQRGERLTGWGQQHDNETLKPTGGRPYELPCLSPSETSFMVVMLMTIQKPSQEVRDAITSAVDWLQSVAIAGVKVENYQLSAEEIAETKHTKGRRVVEDPDAKRIWARCVDTETDTPFFANKYGERFENYNDLDIERRIGYAWYGFWPEAVLAKYSMWAQENL